MADAAGERSETRAALYVIALGWRRVRRRSSGALLAAVGIAIGSVGLGQLGLWLYARTEGGVLTLPDYLVQTFGVLVPLQAALAMGLSWWIAR